MVCIATASPFSNIQVALLLCCSFFWALAAYMANHGLYFKFKLHCCIDEISVTSLSTLVSLNLLPGSTISSVLLLLVLLLLLSLLSLLPLLLSHSTLLLSSQTTLSVDEPVTEFLVRSDVLDTVAYHVVDWNNLVHGYDITILFPVYLQGSNNSLCIQCSHIFWWHLLL